MGPKIKYIKDANIKTGQSVLSSIQNVYLGRGYLAPVIVVEHPRDELGLSFLPSPIEVQWEKDVHNIVSVQGYVYPIEVIY